VFKKTNFISVYNMLFSKTIFLLAGFSGKGRKYEGCAAKWVVHSLRKWGWQMGDGGWLLSKCRMLVLRLKIIKILHNNKICFIVDELKTSHKKVF
jgi:hypothetical protein